MNLPYKKGENYENYDFNNGLKDSSENKRDLKAGKNAEVKDNALVLKDGQLSLTTHRVAEDKTAMWLLPEYNNEVFSKGG